MEPLGLRDIIGPIMIGPSSSHTAGALRIARMAQRLLSAPPTSAHFILYGSFAHTGTGHGTDKALIAGLLGMDVDDLRIRDSHFLAKEAGLDFSFTFADKAQAAELEHSNTVDIHLTDVNGQKIEVRGVSTGGGAAAIRRIDGVDVDISGKRSSLVIHQKDTPGVLAHIAQCLAQAQINIATTHLYRTRRGLDAYTVMEVDGLISDATKTLLCEHPQIYDIRLIPADLSTPPSLPTNTSGVDKQEKAFAACDFSTAHELLLHCQENHSSISEAFLKREQALCALEEGPDEIDDYLDRVLEVMRDAATTPLKEAKTSMGGLIGGEAHQIAQACKNGTAVIDGIAADALVGAMAVLETNACMGRIVATPTAGSSGVLPGVLLALAKHRNLDSDTLKRGVLCAGAVGYLIARKTAVSGAEGGCQAEIGTAAAMAAAAAVEMSGGSPKQALDAASNALCSLMGLVCDPVGGLVEIPCQKRNGAAACIALSCAQMALAGITNLIPFDEVVDTLDAVGKSLPFELRESALGGIAASPSACAWCNKQA